MSMSIYRLIIHNAITPLGIGICAMFVFATQPAHGVVVNDIPIEWRNYAIGAEAVEIANRLNTNLSESLVIQPVTEFYAADGAISRVPIAPSSDKSYLLYKRSTVGLQPIAGIGQIPQVDVIDFSGEADPYAHVTLSIESATPIIQESTADATGDWSISVVVDALPAGENNADIQIVSRGVSSDKHTIASFTVIALQQVSNSTWLFLIGTGFIVLIALVVINFYFLLKRKKQYYSPPPVAEINDELAETEEK